VTKHKRKFSGFLIQGNSKQCKYFKVKTDREFLQVSTNFTDTQVEPTSYIVGINPILSPSQTFTSIEGLLALVVQTHYFPHNPTKQSYMVSYPMTWGARSTT
jgi:hypothetical protein